MSITEQAKWREGSLYAPAVHEPEQREREAGHVARVVRNPRGVRLVCSLSNDAGVAVGVVVALETG